MNLRMLIVIVVWIAFGIFAGAIAARRGRSRAVWTIFGLIFGPLAWLISVITPGATKKCPYCAESIRADAIVCRFCGRELSGSAAEISQASAVAAAPAAVPQESDVVEVTAEQMEELFQQWMAEQKIDVGQLSEEELAKYRAAFEEAVQVSE
jgi:hypothetical protein